MQVSHLSLKQLTVLASSLMSLVFVVCYVTIHFFWSYDTELQRAKTQQQEELNRVKTVINLQKSEVSAALIDYAAWNDVADYITQPNQEFIDDSINDHTFVSKNLSGIFIFDPNVSLIWGRHYDPIMRQERSYEEIRYKFGSLLSDALKSRTDHISAFSKFLVLNDAPVLVATSRVCNSDGEVCNKGYMLMLKPIGSGFSRMVKQATGIDVEVLTKETAKAKNLADQDNISIIERLDYQNQSTVCIIVRHSTQLPNFLTFSELSAILTFAGFMFIVNLYFAHLMIRPLKAARLALDELSKGHGHHLDINSADRFISQEMKQLTGQISRVFNELDEQKRALEWSSHHDALTKVGNRRKLQMHWHELANRRVGEYVSVALIDIDYFKPFNDHYGHLEGDVALQSVAQKLERVISDSDKFVARFGGEEFCIVWASEQPIKNNREAQRLIDGINELAIPHLYGAKDRHWLTISAGIVSCEQHSLNCQHEIFLAADRALYQAKERGRNGYVVTTYLPQKECSQVTLEH